uniref:Uncharacterized protein n=1 Tax=Anguilla anguilla TaxID=7936 RepID=A0A0E9VI23_ANGAN
MWDTCREVFLKSLKVAVTVC